MGGKGNQSHLVQRTSIRARQDNQIALSPRRLKLDGNVVAIDTRKKPSPGSRLLYDRKEAARQLSISIRSLDYLIASKTFQTIRIGKKVMIPHSELVRFASANHYGHMASAS
jgi:Helix-turn-helix domain